MKTANRRKALRALMACSFALLVGYFMLLAASRNSRARNSPKTISQTLSPDKQLVTRIVETMTPDKSSSPSSYHVEVTDKGSNERIVVLEQVRIYMGHTYQPAGVKWLSNSKFRCDWLVLEHGEKDSQTFDIQQKPLRGSKVDEQFHPH